MSFQTDDLAMSGASQLSYLLDIEGQVNTRIAITQMELIFKNPCITVTYYSFSLPDYDIELTYKI